MPSTVQPVVLSADLERLRTFYTELLGATETSRTPDEGPAFYVGLRIGDSDVGLVAEPAVAGAPAGRIILSVEVPDVSALIPAVGRLGGEVTGGPNDMAWGQRVAHLKDPDGNVVNLTQSI